jgi:hypothetical protein
MINSIFIDTLRNCQLVGNYEDENLGIISLIFILPCCLDMSNSTLPDKSKDLEINGVRLVFNKDSGKGIRGYLGSINMSFPLMYRDWFKLENWPSDEYGEALYICKDKISEIDYNIKEENYKIANFKTYGE